MALKSVFAAVCGAAILAAGSSWADEYRPDEFLTLDLSRAALSPKPLGPPSQFEPRQSEATADPQSNAVHVDTTPVHVDATKHVAAVPKHVAAAPKHVTAPPKVTKAKILHARAEKPHLLARTKLVRRHTNPLDAQASDTRIQVWPCKSGGICNWQR
jgi:hypothetical protein